MFKTKRKQIDLGYIMVYKPGHDRAYRTGGYKNWMYEHILVAERMLKRPIRRNEEVHHLDMVRSNNSPENLVVLSVIQHRKIHAWIDNGLPFKNKLLLTPKIQRSIKKLMDIPRCVHCEFPLADGQTSYCSKSCNIICTRKVIRPSKKKLIKLVKKMPWVRVAKRYGVSDNAVRKWARAYGLDPKKLR